MVTDVVTDVTVFQGNTIREMSIGMDCTEERIGKWRGSWSITSVSSWFPIRSGWRNLNDWGGGKERSSERKTVIPGDPPPWKQASTPVSSRGREREREQRVPYRVTMATMGQPSCTRFSDRRRDIPTRKPVQGSVEKRDPALLPGLRRTCTRFRGIERDWSTFFLTLSSFPLFPTPLNA